MRILLLSGALLATASCAWPPPQAEVAVPPPVALAPGPPPVAFAPAPPPVAFAPAPPPAPAPFVLAPLAWLFTPIVGPSPPPLGRLTLNNFSFEQARVQTLITPYPDCAVREGTVPADFELPLNGTRIIVAAPGTDVCWRRQIASGTAQGVAPSAPGWTEWNRVFLTSVPSVDSRL